MLFINDLPLFLNDTNSDIFADDLTLTVSASNKEEIQNKCQLSLNQTNQWSKQNKMIIHKQKTQCMLLGSTQKIARLNDKSINLILNETSINQIKQHKVLGITIDHTLSWDQQVNTVCKSLTTKLSLLNKIKIYLSNECRILYYNAYIQPIMDYCDTIWGNCTKYNLNRITKLQKRAARIILNKPYDSPSAPLFKELKWLSFPNRILYHKAVIMYKSLNGLTPEYISSLFTKKSTDYSLRSIENGNLVLPKFKLMSFKGSLSYSGVEIWNSIPSNIRKATTLKEFKSKFFLYLLNKVNQ